MSKCLIRVKTGRPLAFWYNGEGDNQLRREPEAIVAQVAFNPDIHQYMHDCDFFLVDKGDVDTFVRLAAKERVGHEIEVYELTKVGQNPPGEFVMKRVTEDGILPE